MAKAAHVVGVLDDDDDDDVIGGDDNDGAEGERDSAAQAAASFTQRRYGRLSLVSSASHRRQRAREASLRRSLAAAQLLALPTSPENRLEQEVAFRPSPFQSADWTLPSTSQLLRLDAIFDELHDIDTICQERATIRPDPPRAAACNNSKASASAYASQERKAVVDCGLQLLGDAGSVQPAAPLRSERFLREKITPRQIPSFTKGRTHSAAQFGPGPVLDRGSAAPPHHSYPHGRALAVAEDDRRDRLLLPCLGPGQQ